MGIFGRSGELVKESFTILRKDRELILFPALSSIVIILLFVSLIMLVLALSTKMPAPLPLYCVLFVAYYLLSYFVVTFFNAGLVACAHIRLNGGHPRVKDGLSSAFKSFHKIFVWAMAAATAGLILRGLVERSRLGHRVVVSAFGAAWSLLAFFALPILVIEKIAISQSMKKSGKIFAKTWGQHVVGRFSIGLFFLVLGLIGIVPIAVSFFTPNFFLTILLIGIVVFYWLVLAVISSSLHSIFITALYNYAMKEKTAFFKKDILKSAYSLKK